MPQGNLFKGGKNALSSDILPLMKIFLPLPPLNMEPSSDEKYPEHASDPIHLYIVFSIQTYYNLDDELSRLEGLLHYTFLFSGLLRHTNGSIRKACI